MRWTLAPALAFLGTGICAHAALAQAPSRDPSSVQPGHYRIEPAHTRVLFAVSHLGFTTYYGGFSNVAGALDLAATPDQDKVTVSIPVSTVSTTNSSLDATLKSPQWLDAAGFPEIAFSSAAIASTGPSTATVQGTLTLHGVSRPVTLDVSFNAAGVNPLSRAYTVGFDAHGTLRRSDFGVSRFVPAIGDDVQIIISAAFEKQG